MTLNDLLASGCFTIPWPVRVDGKSVPSEMPESIFCASGCHRLECQEGTGTSLGKTCSNGFTYYQAKIGGATIVSYSVLSENWRQHMKPQLVTRYKADLKGRSLSAVMFRSWYEKIKVLWGLLERDRERLISEALHPLHETPKLAAEIRNAAEGLILARPGASFDDKFNAASNVEKTLFKASEFLVDSFDLLAVFFNPESAKLGDFQTIEPYKLIDKLSRVLAISRTGGSRKNVKLIGTSFRRYEVLESFRLIPLVLMSNAIKYSTRGDIIIEFSEKPGFTDIAVRSTGPAIEPDELEYIFQRGARGRFGQAIDNDGMGVGLFVAKKAAEANGITISVKSKRMDYSVNNIPLAENEFAFRAKDVR